MESAGHSATAAVKCEDLNGEVFDAPKEPEFVAVDEASFIKQEVEEYDRLAHEDTWEDVMHREQLHETVWMKDEPLADTCVVGNVQRPAVATPYVRKPTRGAPRLNVEGRPKPPDDVHHCTVCKATFRGIEFFERHMQTHTTPKFRCGECGKEYKQVARLRHHMKKHVTAPAQADTTHQSCSVCKVYIRGSEYETHMQTHRTYKCAECGKEYQTETSFNEHMQMHEEKPGGLCTGPLDRHQCDVCKAYFQGDDAFAKHVATHNKKCWECGRVLMFEEEFIQHLKTHQAARGEDGEPGPDPPDEAHHCSVCKVYLRGSEAFEKHMETHRTYKCAECGKEYRLEARFNEHMKMHEVGPNLITVKGHPEPMDSEEDSKSPQSTGLDGDSADVIDPLESRPTDEQSTEVKKCRHCDEMFRDAVALKRHMNKCRTKKCRHCSEEFRNGLALTEHMKSHGFKPRCRQCGEEFEEVSDLKDHLKTHAPKTRKCPYCEFEFDDHNAMSEHLKLHDAVFPCPVCGKTFARKPNLRVHMGVHKGHKPYKCKVCGKAFTWRVSLRDHMASFHSDQKPYKCATCGKEFVCKKYFEVHEQIHTGKKPFTCEICGKGFFWGDSLKFHIQAAHNEERRRYKCPECGKQFTQEKLLADHLRVHAMDNLFTCDVCGHVFTQKANLLQHRRIHSGEKPYTCGVCGKSVTTKTYLKAHMRLHYGDAECMCKICGKQLSTVGYLRKHMERHERDSMKTQSTDSATEQSSSVIENEIAD